MGTGKAEGRGIDGSEELPEVGERHCDGGAWWMRKAFASIDGLLSSVTAWNERFSRERLIANQASTLQQVWYAG